MAPTDAEAEEIARKGAAWTVGAYANPGRRSIVSADATEAGPPGHQVDPVRRYVDDVIVWGSPARVVDKLAELRDTIDLRYLMIAPLSHSTFTRFTDQVLPKVL